MYFLVLHSFSGLVILWKWCLSYRLGTFSQSNYFASWNSLFSYTVTIATILCPSVDIKILQRNHYFCLHNHTDKWNNRFSYYSRDGCLEVSSWADMIICIGWTDSMAQLPRQHHGEVFCWRHSLGHSTAGQSVSRWKWLNRIRMTEGKVSVAMPAGISGRNAHLELVKEGRPSNYTCPGSGREFLSMATAIGSQVLPCLYCILVLEVSPWIESFRMKQLSRCEWWDHL